MSLLNPRKREIVLIPDEYGDLVAVPMRDVRIYFNPPPVYDPRPIYDPRHFKDRPSFFERLRAVIAGGLKFILLMLVLATAASFFMHGSPTGTGSGRSIGNPPPNTGTISPPPSPPKALGNNGGNGGAGNGATQNSTSGNGGNTARNAPYQQAPQTGNVYYQPQPQYPSYPPATPYPYYVPQPQPYWGGGGGWGHGGRHGR